MGWKRHRKDNQNRKYYEKEQVMDNNELAVPQEERGIFGKAKDALTSDTAVSIYKGVGMFVIGVAVGIGGMFFCNRNADNAEVCCDESAS